MTIRVGINGFGRMGRLALRAGWEVPGLRFVRVNDVAADAATAAHLLSFDSVHGRWLEATADGDCALAIGDARLVYSRSAAIADADWRDCDIVIEATGRHHKTPALLAGYLEQGVRKVLVAAPTEGVLNIVYGINHALYAPATDHIVTAASCTTNCLAPLVKVMHDALGIVHGSITTIHDVTNTQTLVDGAHKDLRRARAAGLSLIPTTTGSARAITRIFPELEGRLDGHAVRVPLLNASLTDFVFEAARQTTADEVNGLFEAAARGPLAGILGYETRPLVSVDFVNDSRSAIVDALSTLVVHGTQVKVYAWYDNEWGYACRLIDIARMLASSL
ncbi:MAG: ArsJ-associated glyceraldehyde-3-phosphate dehydrogenase [Pseudomonadales bacterium]|nr:ArsJ-associated glyceraldehyde-3-phosphate dehydrogenase [Pseudomonadales bacterium]MCP5185686.1 ArsJ-associated glyceraldehyde-3-phosphate dehydrogenase [Pseudomonadales bacterium]